MTQEKIATERRIARAAPLLFTATIFVSASLLFFVQPLFTKIVLPNIGGAAAVWTTAMLFFQSVLIAGYLYAHFLARYLSTTQQIAVHLVLWALALFFLPLAIPEGWSYDASASPVLQTLALYALGVGLPFAVLSANAPLIQSWYGQSGGPSAEDPYFLYGASNLGSLIALLGFPLLAEPLFGAAEIGMGWAAGFLALGVLLALCGFAARSARSSAGPIAQAADPPPPAPGFGKIALWAFFAFIPSSLMLGVTLQISTDLGSFPLVWAVPLALYLLTFVATFRSRPLVSTAFLRIASIVALTALIVLAAHVTGPSLTWPQAGLMLLAFTVLALLAHQRLFELRPHKAHLTLFYLTLSVGGALGGLFNSILAPAIFNDILELKVTAALASVLLVLPAARVLPRDLTLGILASIVTVGALLLGLEILNDEPGLALTIVVAMALGLGIWSLRNRGYALVAAVAITTALAGYVLRGDAIYRDRSFFGTHRVTESGDFRLYGNGNTVHGVTRIDDAGARPETLYYYTQNGPMGQVMRSGLAASARSIGVIGLGVGALACYGREGQDWHFYEIDRKVDEIARSSGYFRFMSACASAAPTYLGDARIVLEEQAEMRFDILFVDAYSSDAMPIHLATIEAMELYRSRLAPGGLLVVHISNRYYALDRPMGRSAAALGLSALIRFFFPDGEATETGESASIVAIMAEDPETLSEFASDPLWMVLESDGGPLWTDDYSNPLSILK